MALSTQSRPTPLPRNAAVPSKRPSAVTARRRNASPYPESAFSRLAFNSSTTWAMCSTRSMILFSRMSRLLLASGCGEATTFSGLGVLLMRALLCIGILNHLFFWPEQYRRTGGMSIVFLFDENPNVASAGSGGAAVGGARSVPDHAARSNSERAAPSARVGNRFSAPSDCLE